MIRKGPSIAELELTQHVPCIFNSRLPTPPTWNSHTTPNQTPKSRVHIMCLGSCTSHQNRRAIPLKIPKNYTWRPQSNPLTPTSPKNQNTCCPKPKKKTSFSSTKGVIGRRRRASQRPWKVALCLGWSRDVAHLWSEHQPRPRAAAAARPAQATPTQATPAPQAPQAPPVVRGTARTATITSLSLRRSYENALCRPPC